MTVILWTALTFLGGLLMIALGDMVSEEVRHRLDHLPHAILRLAARRLDPALRVTLYEEAWLPDLAYFLKGDEARPVSRLFHGTRFALGILVSARRVSQAAKPGVSGLQAAAWSIPVPGLNVGDTLTLPRGETFLVLGMRDSQTVILRAEDGGELTTIEVHPLSDGGTLMTWKDNRG